MWWILYLALSLIFIFFLAVYLIFKAVFGRPPEKFNDFHHFPKELNCDKNKQKMLSLIDQLADLPFESVIITSFDGLTLYGRYYHVLDGAPLDLGFHGYRGTSVRDLCGCVNTIKQGKRNVLLVEQRANGRSGGKAITFGIKERYDCLLWIDYAVNRFGKDVRIFLRGVSMGGATVLMATGLNLPKNVYGVLADCPYSSPVEIIKKVLNDRKLPVWFFYPIISLGTRLFGRFNLKEITAESAVKNSNTPIIIMHGESDKFVPSYMSLPVKNARKNVEYNLFANAGHALCYIEDQERYEDLVKEFVDKNCPK